MAKRSSSQEPPVAPPPPRTKADFAEMVRDEAARRMEAGELEVSTRDGLFAQKMLDDREAKDADRKLMLTIARMLGSAPVPPTLIVGPSPAMLEAGEVIEGTALDYEDAEQVV